MQPNSVAIVLSVLSSALGHPTLSSRQAQACDAVHVFLARGTSEDYPGRQINVVNAVCEGISSCGYEDILYPASFLPDYCTSVGEGVVNGTAQITAYAAKCPDAQLVLSGYSQVCI
jgi:acetylxylan esterase